MEASSESVQQASKEETTDPKVVAWECFGLSTEEFLHAMTLFLKDKTGKPMGHR